MFYLSYISHHKVIVDQETTEFQYGLEIGVFHGDPATTILPKWYFLFVCLFVCLEIEVFCGDPATTNLPKW